jgi:hypothetical protein
LIALTRLFRCREDVSDEGDSALAGGALGISTRIEVGGRT